MISYHIYFIIYIISHILFIVNSGDAIHPPPKEVGVFLLKMINQMAEIKVNLRHIAFLKDYNFIVLASSVEYIRTSFTGFLYIISTAFLYIESCPEYFLFRLDSDEVRLDL